MRELTPQEQAILDGMEPQVATPKFIVDDTFQRKFLAAILMCPETGPEAIKFVKAGFFSNEAHVMAMEIVLKYFAENNEVPSRWIVSQEMKEKVADKEPDVQLHYRSEVESVYDYYCAGLPENRYMIGKIREWAKKQRLRLSAAKLTDDSNADAIIAEMQKGIEETKLYDGATRVSDNWSDVRGKMESEEWLIPNWIEFGSLAMLSGDPFSGKSHILAEIISSIVGSGKFTRYEEVPKCAVLVVDAENKRRIFVKRLLSALGEGNEETPDGLLRRVDSSKITLPMPVASAPETIRALIKETKLTTGQDKCFVVIDTLRSVLGADEMETSDMKDLLYPLQRVAQEENAAILILHHRPKSGAIYSGQTSIAGALDFLWMWESDIETGIGKLSLKGTRGDYEQPITFALHNGKNNWVRDSETGAVSMKKKRESVVDMLEHILKDGPKKQSEVVKEIQNLWKAEGTPPGINTIRDLVNAQVGESVVMDKGDRNSSVYKLMSSAGGE